MKPAKLLLLAAASGLLLSASCSSDKSGGTPGASTGPAGGLVMGDADTHCDMQTPAVVDPAACTTPPSDTSAGGATSDVGSTGQAGASDCNAEHDADYGETLYGDSGDDDDCKYEAHWASTPIRLNEDVTFTITATDLTTGKPLEALADGKLPLTRLEVYEPCKLTHRAPALDSQAKFSETAPGEYTGGPIRFDESGRWVVRFHFYEECLDGDTSPHGHIAFFVDVR